MTTAAAVRLKPEDAVASVDGRREETLQLGLWMFLATVAMLFAAFTSAYVVRRSGSDWRTTPLPPILWVNTLVLAASSAALEAGTWFGSRRRWPLATLTLILAGGLGAAFLVGQGVAWGSLAAAGFYLPANPSSSFFYVMTGAHGVHVVAAFVVLLRGVAITLRGDGERDPRGWALSLTLCRTFWHFLLGVWLFVLAVLATA